MERAGATKTSGQTTVPIFGEASEQDLAELLARPGAAALLGRYSPVLVDSPSIDDSPLPAPPQEMRAIGPGSTPLSP